ncbi:hypothetical protein, partial [Gordonibacter pamelaeae]|uniref:hypothetical protein n=1 Tax=Gordonibacter pamelaeae TaxID=471189 RepID=UPI002FDF4875
GVSQTPHSPSLGFRPKSIDYRAFLSLTLSIIYRIAAGMRKALCACGTTAIINYASKGKPEHLPPVKQP